MSDMSVPEEISRQLHNTKPDALLARTDVVMLPLDERTLLVVIFPRKRAAVVHFDPDENVYLVIREDPSGRKVTDNVQNVQLGQLVWGPDAKPYTLPTIYVIDAETGEIVFKG